MTSIKMKILRAIILSMIATAAIVIKITYLKGPIFSPIVMGVFGLTGILTLHFDYQIALIGDSIVMNLSESLYNKKIDFDEPSEIRLGIINTIGYLFLIGEMIFMLIPLGQ